MASLKGSYFDNASSSEPDEIKGLDPEDMNIPMGDDDDFEEEEEEEKPAPKKKAKSEPEPDEEEEEEEEDNDEEEEDDEKEEEESEEEESDDNEDKLSSYEQVALEAIDSGVLVIDESKTYSDSIIGIAEMIEDTVEAKIKEKVAEGYDSILDAMELGIPAQQWAEQVAEVDYADADLDDVDTQKYIITKGLELTGTKKDIIEKKLARYEREESLKEEATDFQILLVEAEAKRVQDYQKLVKETAANKRKEAETTLTDLRKDIYSTKEIANFFVSKTEQKRLDAYMTKPVNARGETQYMIDRNSKDKRIATAYLTMKGIDSKQLAKVVESKATKSLKEKLDQRSDKNTSGKGKQVKEKVNTSNRMSQNMPWSRPREIED